MSLSTMPNALWQTALAQKVILAIDYHVAKILTASIADSVEQAKLHTLIIWLSRETRQGHVCVDPLQLSPHTLFQGGELALAHAILSETNSLLPDAWHDLLTQFPALVGDGQSTQLATPLVYQYGKLYFQRLWQDEVTIADYFLRQSQHTLKQDVPQLTEKLASLFEAQSQEIDWQKVAVAVAATQPTAVISGGPGTGKTTTVAKLLLTLIELNLHQPHPLRIQLAAPTGKAAARLTESLQQAMSHLAITEEIQAYLPKEALTLHRLLGAKQQSRFFVHHKDNPLHLDVLVIDEASMVDLSLMASVISALPTSAKLILLGDRQQLASVESGTILGDICTFAETGYRPDYAKTLSKLTGYTLKGNEQANGMSDMVALLHKSYRFDAHSGIGQLASAISRQDRRLINRVLAGEYEDVVFQPLDDQAAYQTCLQQAVKAYYPYLSQLRTASPEALLTLFNQCQLLCALRHGDFGVVGLNQRIEWLLTETQQIQRGRQSAWYVGRPVMIRRNHHELGLFNGDIGITLREADTHQLMVYFRLPNGQIKGFSPHRLPELDTAFAMTVHQSQGSEFDRVILILPEQLSPILTQELIYTAVTRAKQHLALVSSKRVLFHAIETVKPRQSGLVARLTDGLIN